jgi:hypothetical protein
VVIVVTWTTALYVPAPVPPGVFVRYAWECLEMATVAGVPLLLLAAALAARALPTRPALAGGLYGLGVGLLADAGVRLFCWVSDPWHVALAHGGAILALVASGALAATAVDRLRERRSAPGAPPA